MKLLLTRFFITRFIVLAAAALGLNRLHKLSCFSYLSISLITHGWLLEKLQAILLRPLLLLLLHHPVGCVSEGPKILLLHSAPRRSLSLSLVMYSTNMSPRLHMVCVRRPCCAYSKPLAYSMPLQRSWPPKAETTSLLKTIPHTSRGNTR